MKCTFHLKKNNLLRNPCSCSGLGIAFLLRCVFSSVFSSYFRKKERMFFVNLLHFSRGHNAPVSCPSITIRKKIQFSCDWWQIAPRHIVSVFPAATYWYSPVQVVDALIQNVQYTNMFRCASHVVVCLLCFYHAKVMLRTY